MDLTFRPMLKKMRLVNAWMRGYPVWCTWQVTYNCNFRCSFCNYWENNYGKDEECSLDDFRVGAEKLAGFGSLMISLAGGEPFLRRDLTEIIATLAKSHFPFLTTNGWFITPEKARAVFEAGLWGASVSIDYIDPKKHDANRGIEGSYQRAVRALKTLSQERTRPFQSVNLMSVLYKDNLEDIEGLIQLARENNAYFMLQPYCTMKTGDRSFLPDRPVSEHLLSLKSKYPNFLSNRWFLSKFDVSLNGGVSGCRGGKSFFNIDNQGNISICVEFKGDPVGNLVGSSSDEILDILREKHKKNSCQACWYNCRGEVESLYNFKGFMHSLPTLIFT